MGADQRIRKTPTAGERGNERFPKDAWVGINDGEKKFAKK